MRLHINSWAERDARRCGMASRLSQVTDRHHVPVRWETTIVKLWVAVPPVFVAVMVTG